jgi:hypothetical protein
MICDANNATFFKTRLDPCNCFACFSPACKSVWLHLFVRHIVFCLAPKVIENGSVVNMILQEKSKKFVFLGKSMVAGGDFAHNVA